MKVTIDVPAPTYQLELISRLRQKTRNYKLSMKQLQRAHFINKTLLDRREDEIEVLREAVHRLQSENAQLRDENARLLTESYSHLPMPVTYGTEDTVFTNGARNGAAKELNGHA